MASTRHTSRKNLEFCLRCMSGANDSFNPTKDSSKTSWRVLLKFDSSWRTVSSLFLLVWMTWETRQRRILNWVLLCKWRTSRLQKWNRGTARKTVRSTQPFCLDENKGIMNVDNYVVVTLSRDRIQRQRWFQFRNIDDDEFTSETSEKVKKVVLFVAV